MEQLVVKWRTRKPGLTSDIWRKTRVDLPIKYDAFVGKLREMDPRVFDGKTLYYRENRKDDKADRVAQGDLVTFESDEELQEAINYFRSFIGDSATMHIFTHDTVK